MTAALRGISFVAAKKWGLENYRHFCMFGSVRELIPDT